MTILKISLFGVLRVFAPDGDEIILSSKHQALLALLATQDGGSRTRFLLESTIWSRSQPEQARASLRTALSTLRRRLGPDATGLLSANRERVFLDLNSVDFVGGPSQGTLMEGFHLINEPAFNNWLEARREEYAPSNLLSEVDEVGAWDTPRQPLSTCASRMSVLPLVTQCDNKLPKNIGVMLSEELVRHLYRSQAFAEISYLAPKTVEPFSEGAAEIGLETEVSYHLSAVLDAKVPKHSIRLTLLDISDEKVLWGGYSEGSPEELFAGDAIWLSELIQQASHAIVHNENSQKLKLQPLSSCESQKLVIASIALSENVIQTTKP